MLAALLGLNLLPLLNLRLLLTFEPSCPGARWERGYVFGARGVKREITYIPASLADDWYTLSALWY